MTTYGTYIASCNHFTRSRTEPTKDNGIFIIEVRKFEIEEDKRYFIVYISVDTCMYDVINTSCKFVAKPSSHWQREISSRPIMNSISNLRGILESPS